eukprot:gene15056-biopygen9691
MARLGEINKQGSRESTVPRGPRARARRSPRRRVRAGADGGYGGHCRRERRVPRRARPKKKNVGGAQWPGELPRVPPSTTCMCDCPQQLTAVAPWGDAVMILGGG